MKKLMLAIIFMVIAKIGLSQGVSFGIKAGTNYSNIYSTGLKTDFKQGFHAGVYGKINAIIFAIQPEVLLSKRGYTETNIRDISMYYIDVPIMFKMKIFPAVTIDAGPQFSYLLTETIDNLSITNPVMPDYKNAEMSGALGASLQLWKLGASARYILGFSEINKLNTSKNQIFQLSLSLKL